jgi:hypothetical protein
MAVFLAAFEIEVKPPAENPSMPVGPGWTASAFGLIVGPSRCTSKKPGVLSHSERSPEKISIF